MKKEKIIVAMLFILLTLGAVFLYLFGDKYKKIETVDMQLNNIRKSIENITHTSNFYNSEEQVKKILNENKNFVKTDLDLYFSNVNNFDGFILPHENIYCIDAGGSEQTGKNFQSYRVYMSGKLTDEIMNMYGRHSQVAYDYLHNNDFDASTVLGKMIDGIQKNTDELLLYYKTDDYINFRKKLYDINGGVNNIDILTIVFFEKNKLDKNRLISFLNRCFDYNNKGFIHVEYLKEKIYPYLVK